MITDALQYRTVLERASHGKDAHFERERIGFDKREQFSARIIFDSTRPGAVVWALVSIDMYCSEAMASLVPDPGFLAHHDHICALGVAEKAQAGVNTVMVDVTTVISLDEPLERRCAYPIALVHCLDDNKLVFTNRACWAPDAAPKHRRLARAMIECQNLVDAAC